TLRLGSRNRERVIGLALECECGCAHGDQHEHPGCDGLPTMLEGPASESIKVGRHGALLSCSGFSLHPSYAVIRAELASAISPRSLRLSSRYDRHVLYERDEECDRIGSLLDAARSWQSSALVLRGEPGIGKTALLEDAGDRAGGMHVLAASGVESEAELPF